MESICGILQPELIPDWISKVGPAVAALTGAAIYWLNRRNTIKDLKHRRTSVMGALQIHLERAIVFARTSLDRIQARSFADISDNDMTIEMMHLQLDGVGRMSELQTELFKIGMEGDDVISEFIETCRSYELAHTGWLKNCTARTPEGKPLSFIALEFSLRRMTGMSSAVYSALPRRTFVPLGGVFVERVERA